SCRPPLMADGASIASAHEAARDATDEVDAILNGLTAPQKHIAPKYFYDERGSELFDRICELPEYYPTRTELALMREHIHDIANIVGTRASGIHLRAGYSCQV